MIDRRMEEKHNSKTSCGQLKAKTNGERFQRT